ncbi:diphosphomevalonate decarboxylase, partial [Candidatus Woesebacteria bacterium]|nr:diphosphomevalonate decarboxylase [Candidatus Woesebacteria bacterium]
MKKVSVISPANIGLIKYWGFHDETLYIPNNDNIAVTMSNCLTTTTVKVSEEYGEDSIAFASQDGECMLTDKSTMKSKKAYELVEYVRKRAGSSLKAKIVSHNTFPSDAGIAASASSFSALTLGLLHAYELNDVLGDAQEISRIARRSGSASAARSIMGGFVKLKAGGDDQHSFAVQIADEHHWDIVDVVAVVDDGKKILSTSEGHMRAKTNPYFHTRLEEMQPRIQRVRQAIVEKNIQLLGEAIEQEALSMHAITMTSQPPALYFQPGTIALIKNIMRWR